MAKFCATCGAPVKEGDRVCGKCGAPISGTAPLPEKAEEEKKSENEISKKLFDGKKKSLNLVRLIAAVVILILVAVIVVNVAVRFTGYKGALRTMVNALEDFDMDALEKVTSGISNEIYGLQYGDDLSRHYEDMVTRKLDYYEDDLGPIRSIKFQITGESEFSDRRIRKVEEWLEEKYGIDTDGLGIKKIMALDLTLTVKGSKGTEKYYVQDLYLIKERGGWKIYYGSLDYSSEQ